MSDIRNDKEKLKEILMKYVKTDNKGRVLLSKDDDYRNETEWDKIYKEERPCTVLESIEESLKEIKEYEKGKIEFKTLEESRKMWEGWIDEVEKNEKCEWDILSDIFQEAIKENEMSKEDVEKMIDKCIDEVHNEKMPVSKAVLPCLSAEAGEILMADIESTGIRQDVLDRSKVILERLIKEKRKENE